jgi:hypothetical protein
LGRPTQQDKYGQETFQARQEIRRPEPGQSPADGYSLGQTPRSSLSFGGTNRTWQARFEEAKRRQASLAELGA